MHEPFNPQCGYCAKFVYCFDRAGLLADWGFCADEAPGPPDIAEVRRLEELARSGRYDLLYASAGGLYQVTDDGCSRFRRLPEGELGHRAKGIEHSRYARP